MERLALTDVESTSAKAEAESEKGALSLALSRTSKIRKNSRMRFSRMDSPPTASDTRTVKMRSKNYILNLSSIVPPSLEEEAAEKGTAPAEEDAPTAPGPAPTTKAVSEQGDEENNW